MIYRQTKMTVRFLVIFLCIVAGLFTQVTEVSATGGDSEPPEVDIGSITVTPGTVEVDESVTFSAAVTDDLSGVYTVQVDYISPSGNRTVRFSEFYDQEGLLSVNFSGSQEITSFDEAGVWQLHHIYVADHAGNRKSYWDDDIDNPEQYDYTVVNPDGGDSATPEVDFNSISVTPGTVEVGESVTFSAAVTDDLSGVYYVGVDYISPSGNRIVNFLEIYDQEGLLSVDFSDSREITSFDEAGVWQLGNISVADHAGNHKAYWPYDIDNPEQYDFTVVNPDGGDSAPPSVDFSSTTATPDTVEVGESVTVSAAVTDDLSGVNTVQFNYVSPSGNRTVRFLEFYDQEGLLSVDFSDSREITSFDEAGVWQLRQIYVADHAGNYKYYNDIDNPEQYDFTVINTTGPEEKEVIPENGSATVNFPESDVVIVIETDESGTITVTRYPSDNKAPPAGQTAAGIFLNIVPSSSLQGKPATFTVGYETPLPDGIDESTLKIYRWSGSEWEPLANQTLNTSDKTITATVEGFSTFGVFGSDDAVVDDDDEKFEEIVKRFNFSFVFSGLVEHEREIKLPGGVVQYVASGLGDLSGTQSGLTRESPIRKAINYQESYHSATDLEALHDQHMRTITEFEVGRDHAARTGVEPKPGETGYIKQSVESNVDKNGEYLKHNSHYGTSDGITRRVTEIGNEKTTIDVEGYSFGWETVTVEDGGDKTGWWDMD